jgi:hypothetical protein
MFADHSSTTSTYRPLIMLSIIVSKSSTLRIRELQRTVISTTNVKSFTFMRSCSTPRGRDHRCQKFSYVDVKSGTQNLFLCPPRHTHYASHRAHPTVRFHPREQIVLSTIPYVHTEGCTGLTSFRFGKLHMQLIPVTSYTWRRRFQVGYAASSWEKNPSAVDVAH